MLFDRLLKGDLTVAIGTVIAAVITGICALIAAWMALDKAAEVFLYVEIKAEQNSKNFITKVISDAIVENELECIAKPYGVELGIVPMSLLTERADSYESGNWKSTGVDAPSTVYSLKQLIVTLTSHLDKRELPWTIEVTGIADSSSASPEPEKYDGSDVQCKVKDQKNVKLLHGERIGIERANLRVACARAADFAIELARQTEVPVLNLRAKEEGAASGRLRAVVVSLETPSFKGYMKCPN